MRCAEALNLIDANVDGQLSAADRARHDAHLEACPQCAAAFTAARRVCEETRRALDVETPPDELTRRVLAAVAARPSRGLRWRVRRPQFGIVSRLL